MLEKHVAGFFAQVMQDAADLNDFGKVHGQIATFEEQTPSTCNQRNLINKNELMKESENVRANLWDVRNSFPHICGRFSGVGWAFCTTHDRRLHPCGRASGANSGGGRCGRPGNADPRRLGRVCLFGRFCTVARPWVPPYCPCCPAGRCKRSQVCCCNRQHPAGRWNSNQTNLCNLHRNYVGWPLVSEWLPPHRSCPGTNIYQNGKLIKRESIKKKKKHVMERKRTWVQICRLLLGNQGQRVTGRLYQTGYLQQHCKTVWILWQLSFCWFQMCVQWHCSHSCIHFWMPARPGLPPLASPEARGLSGWHLVWTVWASERCRGSWRFFYWRGTLSETGPLKILEPPSPRTCKESHKDEWLVNRNKKKKGKVLTCCPPLGV